MTLRELANLANVSVSSVSKAFSNSKGVSAETREHIFKIAREHRCYEQFHKGKYFKKLIAVICPEIRSEAYHRLVSYLERLITETGATMIVSISRFDKEQEEALYNYHAHYQKVDGIIIIGHFSHILYDQTIPTVRLGCSQGETQDFVACKTSTAWDQSLKHLMEMGHRKIALITEPLTTGKRKRFLETMNRYALPICEEYIVTSKNRFAEGGYKCMEYLLALVDPPTAVIASYDYMAIGAMKCVRDHGLSVPDDISFVGIDNIQLLPYIDPQLTSMGSPYKQQCELAIDILTKKMENHYYRDYRMLESSLVIRNSVKNLHEVVSKGE